VVVVVVVVVVVGEGAVLMMDCIDVGVHRHAMAHECKRK
jgi:hypothetical protein